MPTIKIKDFDSTFKQLLPKSKKPLERMRTSWPHLPTTFNNDFTDPRNRLHVYDQFRYLNDPVYHRMIREGINPHEPAHRSQIIDWNNINVTPNPSCTNAIITSNLIGELPHPNTVHNQGYNLPMPNRNGRIYPNNIRNNTMNKYHSNHRAKLNEDPDEYITEYDADYTYQPIENKTNNQHHQIPKYITKKQKINYKKQILQIYRKFISITKSIISTFYVNLYFLRPGAKRCKKTCFFVSIPSENP